MHPFQFLRAALLRIELFRQHPNTQTHSDTEVPLRAELFGAEQMERYGKTLSALHAVRGGRGGDQLLLRLQDNEVVLQSARELLVAAVRQGRRVTPAGEWLLDNFYLIEEQILLARSHFSKWYSRELPVLSSGPSKGLARVYDIALEVIAHGDGRVDPETLNRFVAAYQTGAQLKLGELWAIPIMLRLALIENLRRISARVAASMVERNRASVWADQMLSVAEHDPKSLILVISDMARASPALVNSFVAELARRLQGHSSALALPLTWIEQQLRESSTTIEQMVQSETQSQAINQVCISNSIASLRLLSAMDWREFVESQSQVERELREDPHGVYGRMDFQTRDRYRHVVERVARQSHMTEPAVARKAVQLAHHALATGAAGAEGTPHIHVGYYLVGDGLAVLERAAQVHKSFAEDVRQGVRNAALPLYLGSISVLSLVITGALLWWAALQGMPLWALVHAGVAALIVVSQFAVTLVNWLATLVVSPHALPRMDYSKGIAPQARTLVVVPTMLSSEDGVRALVEALEVRFLSNQDAHLHYGLLTDWGDASSETQDDDAALLALASDGIRDLNTRYPGDRQDTFFLFHRARLWNEREQLWMGYERKRGKLTALNALLRGSDGSDFALIVGNVAPLQQVQYVITLDTDTQLQRDSARSFAATMAHPLNRPHIDATRHCVTSGYGILQPRMAVSLQSSNRSRYARFMGSEAGVGPYTRAVSDVYQDLFHEGSFIGKGIYDVDAFELALKGRFPENRILSHDLLEGCYARTGLISDVQLYDDYPARYDADVKRRTRWMRGDWQIASWLLPYVPGSAMGKAPEAGQTRAPETRQRNQLSFLSQWKILDNLRRSLVALGVVILLLLLGWTQMHRSLVWTLALLALMVFVPVVSNAYGLLRKPRELPWSQHARVVLGNGFRQLMQAALTLAFFPHEAGYSLLAIVRTNVRVLLTHHRLLEGQASDAPPPPGSPRLAATVPGSMADLLRTTCRMGVSPVLALGIAWWLFQDAPHGSSLAAVVPVLVLWFLAPALAWWLSRPLSERAVHLGAGQVLFLRKLTRKTWRFFEEFVTAQDRWLPPDNYQEHPVAVLAHRTSPTNMGLALLANVSAFDFGYISGATLVARSSDALQSMQRLERHNGHFFNWYDTLTGLPLQPRYVSAVDSGNLSGHLLTLRPALLDLLDQPVVHARTFEGMVDALANLQDVVDAHAGVALTQAIEHLRLGLEAACDAPALTLRDVALRLASTDALAALVLSRLAEDSTVHAASAVLVWARALHAQCRDALDDLHLLLPELDIAGMFAGASVPTLRALAATGNAQAQARMQTIAALAMQATAMARADYGFLYDSARHLIAVGYNVDEQRRDTGYYDLLASEARLCSFVAIALGEVPQENWFALGRLLTSAGDAPTLLSWSGSMFEYLMPNLVMPVYANTLLAQTSRTVVQRQIAYGDQQGVPWGISESGYNAVDAALNYQYHAFGVPGLGLKRGLSADLVVAPYASALALMIMPEQACKNLQRLADTGLLGAYGMYEAMDYTPARLPRGQSGAIVRSFMAHHQGMTLLSLAHVLLEQPMQKRFCSDPLFQATMLLLQERVPNAAIFHAQTAADLSEIQTSSMGRGSPMRVLRNPDLATPEVQLLSNGRYHVMVSQSGAGYSRWKDIAVTRWHEDATRDNWGNFCYLRDVDSGEFWSAAHQPVLRHSDSYEAIFSEGRVEFRRGTTTSRATPKWWFRPKTISNCAAPASPTARAAAAP
jgi:hypothetical protein